VPEDQAAPTDAVAALKVEVKAIVAFGVRLNDVVAVCAV